jgi:hypothetical protein
MPALQGKEEALGPKHTSTWTRSTTWACSTRTKASWMRPRRYMQALQGYEEALSFEKNTQIPRRVQRCPITYAQIDPLLVYTQATIELRWRQDLHWLIAMLHKASQVISAQNCIRGCRSLEPIEGSNCLSDGIEMLEKEVFALPSYCTRAHESLN